MADGIITVEVSTQAAQAELERLRADNAALRREAHAWWTAARDALKLRKPLTEEDIDCLWHDSGAGIELSRFSSIARAVERKVRGEEK